MIPLGGPADYVLEIAGQPGITALLHTRLGYGHVRGCAGGETGRIKEREAEGFRWQVDYFDLERDFYPYPSAHFKTIVCAEVLETLREDPMYMMDEIHRILDMPETKERIASQGAMAKWSAPEEFDKLVHDEIRTRMKVWKAAGVKPE